MGVTAFLSEQRVEVDPGAEAVCDIKVRNTGQVVDQFELQLLGESAEWSAVEPPLINLLPGDESSARVAFKPPRSYEVPAGPQAFGVRVLSREDPDGSTVVEGQLEVAPFTELAVELVPPKGRGRRKAKYRLVVDNIGNQPSPVEIVAVDPEDTLDIFVEHPVLNTEPGTATQVKTKTIPHKRFLRGSPKTHPFQLLVVPEGKEPITTDGVMTQEQLLPKWLLPAAAAALVALVALSVLWFALLKPSVLSAAKEEARTEAVAASNAANKAAAAQQQASDSAKSAHKEAQSAQQAAGPKKPNDPADPNSPANPNNPANLGAAASFRLTGATDPVSDGSYQNFSYVVPKKKTLSITDIVLQNPRGDLGYLRVILDGKVELEVGLANFRDLDFHYVQPLVVGQAKSVTVAVNCAKPGTPEVTRCTPAVSFSARLK